MGDRNALIRRLRAIAALVLVALYILGLAAMLTGRVQLALILWVVSTLGGIGLLYWIRTAEKQREELAKAEAETENGGEGARIRGKERAREGERGKEWHGRPGGRNGRGLIGVGEEGGPVLSEDGERGPARHLRWRRQRGER